MEKETIEKEEEVFRGFDNDIQDINVDDIEEESKENEQEDNSQEEKAESSKEKEEESSTEEKSKEEDKSSSNDENASNAQKEETKEDESSTKPNASEESDQKKEETPAQSKETNSYFAELRRKREAQEKERQDNEARIKRENEIKEQAKLEGELGVLKKNPFTNEAITDAEDLRIYKVQKAIEDKGGDPIADLGKELARISREEKLQAKKQAEEEAKTKVDNDAKAKEDVANFVKKYPKVSTKELAEDQDFQNFASGKFGRWTLEEIYLAFNEKKNAQVQITKQEKKEEKTKPVVEDASKKISKVPSSQANGSKAMENDWLNMSDEDYRKSQGKGDDFF